MDDLKSFSAKFISDAYSNRTAAHSVVSRPDGPNVTYFIQKITGPMNYLNADVLVGFYSNEAVSFNVKIGNTFFTNHVAAEHFVFALNDTVIPLAKLTCHDVEVITDEPVDVYGIFAFLKQSERMTLISSDVIHGQFIFSNTNGMFVEPS